MSWCLGSRTSRVYHEVVKPMLHRSYRKRRLFSTPPLLLPCFLCNADRPSFTAIVNKTVGCMNYSKIRKRIPGTNNCISAPQQLWAWISGGNSPAAARVLSKRVGSLTVVPDIRCGSSNGAWIDMSRAISTLNRAISACNCGNYL